MNVLRSHKHNVFAETVNKVTLSSADDKKIICNDGIHTHAHGHYRYNTDVGGNSVSLGTT